jgi:hypothetical protein
MFKCKVCAEKDLRIQDLKSQIASLQRLVTPVNDPNRVPAVHMEADGILSGQQHIIELPADMAPLPDAEPDELSERDRILSANY